MAEESTRTTRVTEQDCREGIAAARRTLAYLGTSEEDLDRGQPACHHEAEAYDELRKWRFLLTGSAGPAEFDNSAEGPFTVKAWRS